MHTALGHAQIATRRLAQQTVEADTLARMIVALGLARPILASHELAARARRHHVVLAERTSHRVTRLAALVTVEYLALFAHHRCALLARSAAVAIRRFFVVGGHGGGRGRRRRRRAHLTFHR